MRRKNRRRQRITNDSAQEMMDELRQSKGKAIFMGLMALGAVAALATGSLPGLKSSAPIAVTYDEMMSDIYLSGRTSAQESAKKSDYVGERVAWSGSVIDAKKSGWSYTVQVSDGDSAALTDIFLEGVGKQDAVSLSYEDRISFEGTIDRFTDGVITGYVHLTDVSIQ